MLLKTPQSGAVEYCPRCVGWSILLLVLVVVNHLVVGVVILLTVGAGLSAALSAAHVGACALRALRVRLLVELLAHRVEELRELLGRGLDGVGVVALEGLLELVDARLDLAQWKIKTL